jgi:hypothetical protein
MHRILISPCGFSNLYHNLDQPSSRSCGGYTTAKLIDVTPSSMDRFIADETGNLDWAAPDEEVFAFVADLVCRIGMYLYGRKM